MNCNNLLLKLIYSLIFQYFFHNQFEGEIDYESIFQWINLTKDEPKEYFVKTEDYGIAPNGITHLYFIEEWFEISNSLDVLYLNYNLIEDLRKLLSYLEINEIEF